MSFCQLKVAKEKLTTFRDDASGAIAAFSIVAFLTMFVAVGIGMDFMRHEAHRAELQDAIDRGILAAATFTDGTDAEEIVRDYLKSTKLATSDINLNVTDNPSAFSNTVTATASYDVSTFFLKVLGISELKVHAIGAAQLGLSNIEISLALDISGSMARELTSTSPDLVTKLNNYEYPTQLTWGGNSANVSRLDLMRVAASDFVDEVLTNSTSSTTSVSLIPFSGNVNPGRTAFQILSSGRDHGYSSCIDIPNSLFNTSNLPAIGASPQTPHFQWYRFEADYGFVADWGWCPSDAQAIEYFSNDAAKLKQRISDFRGHDGTGTNYAMKWAVGLLDNDANPLIQSLVTAGEVSSDFNDRPLSHSEGVLKVIVLMTDGGTTEQMRIAPEHYLPDNGDSHITDNEIDYWAHNSLGQFDAYTTGNDASVSLVDKTTARNGLQSVCNLAKDDNVIIFTIGFDIAAGSIAETDLESCASTDSHYFDVTGASLNDAFSAIATTITKLRLVN